MKFAIFALAATMLVAGSASASGKVTDVDFLRANRCKGLASTLTGVVDPASLDSFIKAARGSRAPYVMERAAELSRDVAPGATIGTVWRELAVEFPDLARYERSISSAVNLDYARMDRAVCDGDEIAFLPPVSGG